MKRFNTILLGLLCLLFATDAVATKRKKRGGTASCNTEAYSSEIVKETPISETCTTYEIKVSYDGSRANGLSHYSIAIPCGEIKDASNSENWTMVFGKDRTTGVYGLKVDNISRFGERGADSFTIKFTWCSSSSCTKELGIVASKYGQCVDYDTLNQEDPEPPQNCSLLTASLQKENVTCPTGNDGQIKVTVAEGEGPFTYTWSNGSTTDIAENLPAGKYAVTIKDAKGNILTLHEELFSPPPIVISESVINPTCTGVANGSIDLSVTGGTGAYTFAWSHGSSLEDLSSLLSGLYTVTVSDSLGCSVQKTFMLTNSSLLTATGTLKHASCTQADGGIDVTPFGGVAPYTYLWSNGATTQDLQNVGAGTYTVKISDAVGCATERSYTLQIRNTLSVTFLVTPTSCLGDSNGAIDLTISGTAPYNIQWQDGPTAEDRSGLTAGNYKVTVSDATGCSQQLTISVFKKPLQVTSIVNQPKCSGDLGTISVTPTDGIPPYTYQWSNGATGNTIGNLTNGVYNVTITDASGCSRTLFFAILTPTPIEVTSAINNAQCGQEGAYAIDLTVMGGKFPYVYTWSNGATTQDVSGLNTGSYSVDIKDGNGCVVTKQFVIDPIAVSWNCLITPITAPVVCQSAGNIITTGVSGGTKYVWTVASADNSWVITSGSADSAAVYTAGTTGTTATFTLAITKNGCVQTCSYTVTSGCTVRDNTGGGDPSSSEPCTTPPPTPPTQPEPEPEPEQPSHSCKPQVHVYPNPFHDKVYFQYVATKNENIRLEIYDGRGKKVAVVFEGPVKAGNNYKFDWSAYGCGKDRYFYYRLTTSKGVEHGKLVKK